MDVAKTSMEIVHDVSFAVAPGEVLGIVGESGCGKTTVALAVLGGTRAGASITSGQVTVDRRPMLGLSDRQLQVRRGRDVAYVSQDPTAALNPALRIERQLTEMLEVHAPELDRRERGASDSRNAGRRSCRATRAFFAAIRTSCPVGSSSGLRLPWQRCSSRRRSSWTSRRRASTSQPRPASFGPSATCARSSKLRSSTSRTILRWSASSPTVSWSSMPAGRWSLVRRAFWSDPSIPTPVAWSERYR